MSSTQLGRSIVAALLANGCDQVVLCPGSRSTPIALALAERADRFNLHTRSDERVAGFTALGMAKAAGLAAVVVTSGTAVGNLLPAVMEARHTGVGLLVITADRPATLVGTGANQTTWQYGIFAGHALEAVQLASTDAQPQAWTQAVGRACARARGARTRQAGPVQLNACFTEPFYCSAEPWPTAQPVKVGSAARGSSGAAAQPGGELTPSGEYVLGKGQDDGVLPGAQLVLAPARSVVLAGDATIETGRAARLLAEQAQLPLLAEPSSNARHGPCAIARYRELVDTELGAQIERVLVYGHPTLSRPISRLLSRADIEIIVVTESAEWPDPGWQVSQVVDAVSHPVADPAWLAAWQRADAQAFAACPAGRQQQTGLLEVADGSAQSPVQSFGAVNTPAPLTGTQLAHLVLDQARGPVMLGASNPIRDADLAPISTSQVPIWANRGLAGIDGTCSTAAGISLASGQEVTVLLGDLSFLHDIGALHIPAGEACPKLRIIVADDDGGSIFATLEVGDDPAADRFFRMAHGRDLVAIARGFGWQAERVSSREELAARLSVPTQGVEVLVVPIEQRWNLDC